MEEKTSNVSSWVIIISWILVILSYMLEVNEQMPYHDSPAGAMGAATVFALIPGIIGIMWCAKKNVEWASKINKNKNIAYAIGFLFNLLGTLMYWIYYKVNIRELKKPKEEVPGVEYEEPTGKTVDELDPETNEIVSRLDELKKEYASGNMVDEEYEELRNSYQEKLRNINRRMKQ